MAKTILGFDIGETGLKVAQLSKKRVKKLTYADMPHNMVSGGTIVSYNAMGEFLRATLRKARIRGGGAAVILPAELVYLQHLKMPLMTTDQLAVNLPYEFKDFLTMDKDKYFYDYLVNGIIPAEEGTDHRDSLDLVAAVTAKENIENYRAMFRMAGLRLDIAIPVECAYKNLIRKNKALMEKEIGILDLGHSSTRLTIYKAGIFETTVSIELGGSLVDQAIAEDFNVDRHVARTYKLSNYEDCLGCQNASRVYGQIASELRKALNFYNFSNRDSMLSDIYICGGGVHIPPLMEAVGQSVGDILLHPVSEIMPRLPKKSDPALYAAAIGAAVQ